jgi:hypothetical protein
MDDYSVLVQAKARMGGLPEEEIEDRLEDFAELVAARHGTAGATTSSWEARVSIDAEDPQAATAEGLAFVTACAAKAGLPRWPVVRLEAVRGDVLDAELARPNYPDLVSGPEAAGILHVSRQRLHQLYREHPEFPAPLYQLKVGPLWLRTSIEAFERDWERKPGRRAKDRLTRVQA